MNIMDWIKERSSNPSPGRTSRAKYGSKGYRHSNVHFNTVYDSEDIETTKCQLTDEWIKEIWFIHTMECHLAIKKTETMPYAATWMCLAIIIVSEVSQAEKD